jgi:hypothetical protein
MPLTLADAIALRHGGGTNSDYEAALAISDRIKSRFKRASDFAKLSAGEQLFHELFFGLDGEVENGGLHQYLSNSSGDDAERVREHLARIGARDTLAALDRVRVLFDGDAFPENRQQRTAALRAAEQERDEFGELFEAADHAYARAAPDLHCRLMDYVESHQPEFALP